MPIDSYNSRGCLAWQLPETGLTLSPELILQALRQYPAGFWLDTASTGNTSDGWSYIGLTPRPSQPAPTHPKSISHMMFQRDLLRLRPGAATPPEVPPFQGGWVGYLGYEYGRLRSSGTEINFPPLCANFFDTVLAYSHRQKRWWGCFADTKNSAEKNRLQTAHAAVDQILAQFASLDPAHMPTPAAPVARLATSSFSRERYVAAARRALEYIAAGDVYQLNLAQRFTVPWTADPLTLYAHLRNESPAAYGAYFGGNFIGAGQSLCSISPELFLSVRGGDVTTRPIKGTRPRGATADATRAARAELEGNAKERAELNMIVDLERNDLGRVCVPGSVRVLSSGVVEELPTLLHRVGTVTGRLHPRYALSSLIAACFPGGSVTGAPKRRAMQIIEELEPVPRGPYCGAIGWIGWNGQMDLAIAIRTALYDRARQTAYYHAGSGIVADSDPALEYEESLHKAAAFFRATNATLQA